MISLTSSAETRALGAKIAAVVRAGDLIVLDGPLGAGKTVFVQGLAGGLGAAGPVTSPTFVIARLHEGGRLPLVHVDAYRLQGRLEVDDLDLDTDLADAVVAVEWGAGLVEELTDAHLRVQLVRDPPEGAADPAANPAANPAADPNARRALLHAAGGDWSTRLIALGLPPDS